MHTLGMDGIDMKQVSWVGWCKAIRRECVSRLNEVLICVVRIDFNELDGVCDPQFLHTHNFLGSALQSIDLML